MPPLDDKPPVVNVGALQQHIDTLIHGWFKVALFAGALMFPLFWFLDLAVVPASASWLLPRFAIYRVAASLFLLLLCAVLRITKPSAYSVLYGHCACAAGSFAISLMTTHLGGFDSTYYAGLILVQIMVGTVPWSWLHASFTSSLVIAVYVATNVALPTRWHSEMLINNLFFLVACGAAVSIWAHLRHQLTVGEFLLRSRLHTSLDALSDKEQEMALDLAQARTFQQASMAVERMPPGLPIRFWHEPAEMLSGDFFNAWGFSQDHFRILMVDVVGHGIQASLRAMTIETAYHSLNEPGLAPWQVLAKLNNRIVGRVREANRLAIAEASDEFDLSLMYCANCLDLIREGKDWRIRYTNGALPDMLLLTDEGRVEFTELGTYQGITTEVDYPRFEKVVPCGTRIFLFTDGLFEAVDSSGEAFGQEHAHGCLSATAPTLEDAISNMKSAFKAHTQGLPAADDITLVGVELT